MVTVSVSTIQTARTVSGARTSSRTPLGAQLQASRTALAEVAGDEFSAETECAVSLFWKTFSSSGPQAARIVNLWLPTPVV